MAAKVAIVDYGLGNLSSVAGALEKLGYEPLVAGSPEELETAERLILPGVGAFGDGMEHLRQRGLVEPLTRMVLEQGKPILGICLGAQLFARESEEFGQHRGLGWVDARVVRIETGDPSLRVPHVGWNDLYQLQPSALFEEIPHDALFYYVHSFHVQCNDPELVIGETEHGVRLTAAFQRDNLYATQFHPEKSQRHGLKLLENFLSAGC